jgi:hypothetical protein
LTSLGAFDKVLKKLPGGKENMRSKYILPVIVSVILLIALMSSTVLAAAIVRNVPGDSPDIQTAINAVDRKSVV